MTSGDVRHGCSASDDEPEISAGVWCETGSARAIIAAAIAGAVDRLHVELPRARAGQDPEGVHQARVATRRLRSDLRTFAPLLDDEWRERTRAELRALAGPLGAVRDLDVLAIRLGEALGPAGVDPTAARGIFDELASQHERARAGLIEMIDDPHTAALLERLRADAADPPTTGRAIGHAERRLPPLVRRPWRKLRRAVERLDDEPPVPELHRVRLLAKRTRYAAEAVSDACGRPAKRFARAVTGIQDVLGDMNDADVARLWLEEAVPSLDPAAAFAAGRLAAHFDQVAADHHHGWERHFERARKRSAWLDD
jgi:CHAD domain-containing protein